MTARILIAICLLLAAAMPSLAQGNGNGNPGNSGNSGNAGGNGNAGNGNMENAGAGNSNAGGGGGNNGGGNGAGHGAGRAPVLTEPAVVPEADILSMVRSGQAVSLSSLLPGVQARSGGQIIDAQLVRTPRILIYAVKVLTPDGHVGTEYYNARSGAYIEVR
jgi:hypothetical protein